MLPSILSRIPGTRGRTSRRWVAEKGQALFLHGRADYAFEVVGVANHRTDIFEILDRSAIGAQRISCIASLILCDGKPYERRMVAVAIAGRTVGYCPSHLSTRYREWLERWCFADAKVHCNAVILCGERAGGEKASGSGVKLDIELPFKLTTI